MINVKIDDKTNHKKYKFQELKPGKIYKVVGPEFYNGLKNENLGDIVTITEENGTLISLKPVDGCFWVYFTPKEIGHEPEDYIEEYIEFRGTITIEAK